MYIYLIYLFNINKEKKKKCVKMKGKWSLWFAAMKRNCALQCATWLDDDGCINLYASCISPGVEIAAPRKWHRHESAHR